MNLKQNEQRPFLLTTNNKIFIGFSIVLSILIISTQYKLAGMLLAVFIFIGLILSIKQKDNILYSMTWVIGFAPFLTLLRPFVISYSGFTIIIIIIFMLYIIFARKSIIHVISDKYILLFLSLFSFYIIFGLLESAHLISFLKYVEYIIGTILIATLFLDKEILAEGLINLIAGTILFFMSIISNMSNRFVMSSGYGFDITADPSAVGAFIVISLIIVLFDSGKLININNKSKIKNILIFLLFIFLILSTSRTNAVIVIVMLVIYALSQSKKFFKYALLFLPIMILTYPLLSPDTRARIEIMYINKLDINDRSLDQLTTGRSDQWAISIYHIYDTSWKNKFFGSGIGNKAFYGNALKKYGFMLHLESVGRGYVLHSLYLILAVEMGLIAIIYFVILLLYKLFENYKLFKLGFHVPLYFTIAYMLTIFANQGIGILGAIFIAFIFYSKQIYYSTEENYEVSNHY